MWLSRSAPGGRERLCSPSACTYMHVALNFWVPPFGHVGARFMYMQLRHRNA